MTDLDNAAVSGAVKPLAAKPSGAQLRRVVDLARAARNRARSVVERAMHARRRAKARAMLSRTPAASSVLFLCHGNICRSSFAEYAFRRAATAASRNVIVSSAGFVGPGRQPPHNALRSASRRGLDMASHRSRILTQQMLDESDIVAVMSADQARQVSHRMRYGMVLVLGDLDPEPIRERTIRDPWGEDERVFDRSYDRIDRCLAEMIRAMGHEKPGAAVT